jgi:hypothetical protein
MTPRALTRARRAVARAVERARNADVRAGLGRAHPRTGVLPAPLVAVVDRGAGTATVAGRVYKLSGNESLLYGRVVAADWTAFDAIGALGGFWERERPWIWIQPGGRTSTRRRRYETVRAVARGWRESEVRRG